MCLAGQGRCSLCPAILGMSFVACWRGVIDRRLTPSSCDIRSAPYVRTAEQVLYVSTYTVHIDGVRIGFIFFSFIFAARFVLPSASSGWGCFVVPTLILPWSNPLRSNPYPVVKWHGPSRTARRSGQCYFKPPVSFFRCVRSVGARLVSLADRRAFCAVLVCCVPTCLLECVPGGWFVKL